jgi:glucokinase
VSSGAPTAALGIDVGGTKVLGVAVDAEGAILDRRRTTTPTERAEDLVAVLGDLIEQLGGRRETPLGIGLPGLVDRSGALLSSPHLGCAVGLDLAACFPDRPLVVRNDAEVALVAESSAGAARGVDDVVLLTVGTGIGGALRMGGVLQRGAHGLAGEPGHLCLVPDGERCACGQRGCFERYVSGPALARLGRRAGLGDEDLEGDEVLGMAEVGEPRAMGAVATMGAWLGRGLAGIVALLDPSLVLLGGGVGSASELLLDGAREALGAFTMGAPARRLPVLARAGLGEEAGALGAAELARSAGGAS